jgi:hypothetical protein
VGKVDGGELKTYPFEATVAFVGFFAREAAKAIVFFFGLTRLVVIEGW